MIDVVVIIIWKQNDRKQDLVYFFALDHKHTETECIIILFHRDSLLPSPNLEHFIFTTAGYFLTVGTVVDGVDLIGMAGKVEENTPLLDVPYLQGTVSAAGHQKSRIGGPGDLIHGLHVAA